MADPTSWRGEWRVRVLERARALGYDNLTDFAAARPLAATPELAAELGAADVNAVQVTSILREEAETNGRVDEFARDLLLRKLRQSFPEGWPITADDSTGPPEQFEMQLTAALANWSNELPDSHAAFADRVTGIVLDADVPGGWLPTGIADPILGSFFEKALGRGRN